LFTVFGILYLKVIEPDFVIALKKNESLGMYLNNYPAIIQIIIEGMAPGFVFSFIIMQWKKQPRSASNE